MTASKTYRFFQYAIQGLIYSYSAVLGSYFILRLIFWDRLWPIALASLFIPLILLPLFLVPFLSLCFIKKRWFSIISSVACLWLLGWLHINYWSPEPNLIGSSQASLKILSLNLSWYKTSSEALVELIHQENPDIICLQEVTRRHTQRAFRWLKASYPYQSESPSLGILSHYPIRFSETIHLARHREFQQRAIIQVNQQDIVIYNIQTLSPWIRPQKILPFLSIPVYEYAQRSAEIRDLVQRLQRESHPMIVAGDFNMTEQSQDYNSLTAVLNDAFKVSGLGFGFTWPQGWELSFLLKNSAWKLNYPLFRIDYIWYSQHWKSRSTKVLRTTGSDHLPVITELRAKF